MAKALAKISHLSCSPTYRRKLRIIFSCGPKYLTFPGLFKLFYYFVFRKPGSYLHELPILRPNCKK